ncbi:hypothetical protein [Mechercharimyces sp. CAU 1602]|uniref:hypothetical protein n=1 Tax=Mechercharimyces sp. CAU 1602 TaxID=2973933 RepID=UPI002162A671|nr:hypothetical protein [Mechercharimyces sp. CAU 1602]
MKEKKDRFRGEVERTRMMIWIHERDKHALSESLLLKGLDITTFLLYQIHLFCEEMERKIRNGAKEVPKERNPGIAKEERVEIGLRLDKTLKERFDKAIKYVPESKNEMINKWISEYLKK